MITRVKGTADWLSMTSVLSLMQTIVQHLHRYGYREIATPIIEQTALFQRALGEATDVVHKEMFYVTTQHEAGYELCLRPEMTASIIRAYVNENIQEAPWNVFSWGPVFRHERPQKGRLRQFHQVSIESIKSSGPATDALFISMLERMFEKIIGIESYALLINYLGCLEDRKKLNEALHVFLEKNKGKICATCTTRSTSNVMRVFDCKNETCQELYKAAPTTIDCLCDTCKSEWHELCSFLEQLSVSYVHMPRLVRGLDYYEKTVFEFTSPLLGAQSTFCGGGRYARLAQIIGAKNDAPSIGAGIGIERMLIILEELKKLPQPSNTQPMNAVIALGAEQQATALLLSDELHAAGIHAITLLDESSLKNALKKANAHNVHTACIIGSNERESGSVLVKNMLSGAQECIALKNAVTFLK